MNTHSDETKNPLIVPSFRILSCGTFRVESLTDAATTVIYQPIRTAQWGGSTYPRLLLKGLLCCPGRRARREVLLEMLWPECEPEQASHYFNTGATKLRTLLRLGKGQESLLTTEENAASYSLEGQQVLWVDADAALLLLKEAERIGRTTPQALPLLEEAAGYLERGPFLDGEEGRWMQKQRKLLEDARYRCQLWLAESYEQQGMPGQAETLLSALLADDPTDEDVLRRLLLFLQRQDMAHKGCRLYEETKRQLKTKNLQFSQAMLTFAETLCHNLQADWRDPNG